MVNYFSITQTPDATDSYFYPESTFQINYGNIEGTILLNRICTADNYGYHLGCLSTGTYRYDCCASNGIKVYTFDGSSLSQVTQQFDGYNSSEFYRRLDTDGTYIYVVSQDQNVRGAIRAYSFNGSEISQVSYVRDGINYEDVYCHGGYIFATVGSQGLYAYSFNGSTFTLIDTDDQGGTYTGVWGDGQYIYVGNYSSGVRAYSFNGATLSPLGVRDDGGYYRFGCCYYDSGSSTTYICTPAASSGGAVGVYTFNGSTFTLVDEDTSYTDALACWADEKYIYVSRDSSLRVHKLVDGALTTVYTKSSEGDYDITGDDTVSPPYIHTAKYGGTGARVFRLDLYENVDDTVGNSNGDTDYIYSTTSASVVSVYFDLEDYTTETGDINYVQLYCQARALSIDSGSTSSFYLSLTDGTNYSNSINRAPITTGYLTYSSAFSTTPAGGSWSWSDINSLAAGVKLKADDGNELRVTQLYLKVNYTPAESTVTLLIPDKVTRLHSRNIDRYLFPDGQYSVIDSGRSGKILTLSGIHVTDSVTKIQEIEQMLDYGNNVTLSGLPDTNMNTTYLVINFEIDDMSYNSMATDRTYKWTLNLEKV